jgi:hypothetical protein
MVGFIWIWIGKGYGTEFSYAQYDFFYFNEGAGERGRREGGIEYQYAPKQNTGARLTRPRLDHLDNLHLLFLTPQGFPPGHVTVLPRMVAIPIRIISLEVWS